MTKLRLAELAELANGDDGISEAISQWAEREYDFGAISPEEIAQFRDGVWSLGMVAEDNS